MKNITFFLLPLVIFMAACDTDPVEPMLPSTYNFANVSYSGQTNRLDMLAEMVTEMKKANSGGTVDGTLLLSMFANENSPFSDNELNASGKQLKSKCFDNAGDAYTASTFEYYISRLGSISSQAGNTWSPGTAGVATSGSKAYFFDEGGVEYTQIIEKGLMGAVFYYQMAETYTREGKIGNAVDNEIVIDGEGTDMEHHWDEAFGYFGAPKDLTGSNVGDKVEAGEARYHAKYSEVGQDVGLNTTQLVMNELIKGRFYISNKDMASKDAAASNLRMEWEKVLATTCIHYINGAQQDFADDALRNHQLSEAYAFLISLYYNSDKVISNSQLSNLRSYLEYSPMGSPNPVPGFINVTLADLTTFKNTLSTIYGLDDVKDLL